MRGLRGRVGQGRGGDQMLTITRTRANWERFNAMLEEFQNSNNNQVGHRGPASNTGREHADDIVTTNSPNLVTLDSSVEEVSDDEISVVPPSPANPPRSLQSSLSAAPILPILPIIPLPHTIMPDLSRLRMSPARPATAAAAPSPSTSPTSSPHLSPSLTPALNPVSGMAVRT